MTVRAPDGHIARADFQVLQQAAEWFALLGSPTAGDADRQRWRAWHAANPAHREAWARVEAISTAFDRMPAGSGPTARTVLDVAAQRQAARRRAARMLLLLGGTGIAAWAVSGSEPWQAWTAAYRSTVGAQREIRLADGATVWLNTASAMDVDYGQRLRRVILRTGEILVQTRADTASPARPFVVDTGQGRLRALGTRFGVRQSDGDVTVAVFDGAVEILPRAPGAAPRIVRAGEQSRFDASRADPPVPAEAGRQSWARGLLVADDMRLDAFLAELARYRRGHLGCDPDVAGLRIVGTYALADTDRVLAALEATLPVRVHAVLPWWVAVQAR